MGLFAQWQPRYAEVAVPSFPVRGKQPAVKGYLRFGLKGSRELVTKHGDASGLGISLARFDYLSQLHRHRAGLKMKALSRCLMVTGGNITGLTDELERDALVVREPDPADGRSSRVTTSRPSRRGSAPASDTCRRAPASTTG